MIRRMKRNRKTLILLLAVFLLSFSVLSGCSLAKEDTPEDLNTDRLYGVLITKGQQVNTSIPAGTTFNSVEELINYDHTKRITAVPAADGSCVFEGVDGYLMALFRITQENGEAVEPYYNFYSDPAVLDVKLSIAATDTGDKNGIEGTFIVSRFSGEIYFLNPVYLKNDGTVYVNLGSTAGLSFSPGSSSGAVFSKALKEEYRTAIDGKTESSSVEFKVNFQTADGTATAVIKEMNADDEVLRSCELKPDETSYRILPDTAYVILEETTAGKDAVLSRSIYSVPADEKTAMKTPVIYFEKEHGDIEPVELEFLR